MRPPCGPRLRRSPSRRPAPLKEEMSGAEERFFCAAEEGRGVAPACGGGRRAEGRTWGKGALGLARLRVEIWAVFPRMEGGEGSRIGFGVKRGEGEGLECEGMERCRGRN